MTIYKILQEQLTNVKKYSKASLPELTIRSINGSIDLQVKDDGVGFDTTSVKHGIGLENIRRRVAMLNGKLEIISAPGCGCMIHVQLPY